jgi:uncharacterized protein
MDRNNLVLATLATAEQGTRFTPVQVQKIFFLIDRRGAHLTDGPHFDFQPYDYGPFDNTVYSELEQLEFAGSVQTNNAGRYRLFSLTPQGYEAGRNVLATLLLPTRTFLKETVVWVRSLGFNQLVAAIYREYPDMKTRSVFNQ